jgi:hypothetical protein
MISDHQTLYSCPDKIVKVIRKSTGLRRYPVHNYACVLFILKPGNGTRVRILPNGDVEFMPNFDEIKAALVGIDPALVTKLPDGFHNKPRERQQKFQRLNKTRLQRKRSNP